MAEKLKEYCTVISGYAFKSKDLSEGTDIPVIKIGNISNGKNVVIDDSTQYVNEEFLSVDEKYHIKNGDILISLTGSHMNQPNSMVGRCCRNLDDTIYLLNQRAGKIIPNKSVDKDFLYYVFRLPSIQYAIANRAYGGANQVNVSPKDVMGIKFDIPDITIQKKIADVLNAYDSLIQNNNKRIHLLEQMAENLYKEWFVRFRFPEYEDVEFEDGMPKEIKVAKYKAIEINELKEYIEQALEKMLNRNCTRTKFSERFKRIIDSYNAGGTENEDYYEQLVKLLEELRQEDNRANTEGLTEEELEIYDLLIAGKKLTQGEEQKVKLSAKNLYKKLVDNRSSLLVVDWYKDEQPRAKLKYEVELSLNDDLPESYDKAAFDSKVSLLMNHFVDMAVQGYGWIGAA